ncbi:hypothetical protein [Pantoea phage LIMEzero]|uniref:Uncharacterized protein n=1 Tax=Pantoea phage LIMEzero TaxID=943335 RepID=F4N9R5_9CAUD|nr:hypothetical protein LIMEzero_ORF12 [Pantoea phage LIMEzero]CBY88543.1 hypothetical protein [Pantoea phage LIMEzero]
MTTNIEYIIKQYVDPVDGETTFAAFTPDLQFVAIAPTKWDLDQCIAKGLVDEPVAQILENEDYEYDDYRTSLRAALAAPAVV